MIQHGSKWSSSVDEYLRASLSTQVTGLIAATGVTFGCECNM